MVTDRQKILACLLVAVLAISLPVAERRVSAQEPAGAVASIPPAVQLDASPVTSALPAGSDPALRPHQLKGVRLQPLAKTMRLILMFDRPTAYAIRQDLESERVYLDLINTQVGYLSADLHRIEDDRLGGVWLKRVEPGLTTLELRLNSPDVHIEHFSMDDPPAIVLDLERTDQDWAIIPRTQARTIAIESPPADTFPVESRPKPVVPLDQLALLGELPSSPATDAVASSTTVPSVPVDAGDPPEAVQTPELEQDPAELTQGTVFPHDSGENGAEGQQLVPDTHDGTEIRRLNAEYDFFPIDAVNMSSPLGEEIMEDFLYRRWGTVLSKGLQYLELNPLNGESAYLLYLMAEARWQMASAQEQLTGIHDLQNFYRQALKDFGKGELANFAHWRLAHIALKTNDLEGAVAHLNNAVQSHERNIEISAQVMKARILIEQMRLNDALELLRSLDGSMATTDEKLMGTLLAAQAQVMQEDYAGAWDSFLQADDLYKDWETLRPDPAELKARAALHLEKYQQAREILENISINFPHREQDKRIRAGLLYIEVLARLGDVNKAEQFYYDLFHNLGETDKGREILEELYRLHPDELLEGQGHFCKLLMRQGKIREAMSELDRAYNQCLKEGVNTRGLEPVIEVVVPAYLEHTSQSGNNYDIVHGWWLYGSQVKDRDARLKCQSLLAMAYENLGFYDEALQLTTRLCEALPSAMLPSSVEMNLRRSRLLIENGQIEEAIPQLEGLVNEARDWPTLQEIYSLLGDAYTTTGRDLESAQAWQTLSKTPDLPPEKLGSALVEAGEIFLDHQMTTQTLELGLQGLIYEKELAERQSAHPGPNSEADAGNPWGNDSGQRLRAMLGQTYFERGDYGRSIIVLDDLLTWSGLPDDERCKIMIQVAESHRRLGQVEQALRVYEQLADSEKTPPIWQKMATQWRDNLRWNLDNPNWVIPGDSASQPVL